MLTFMVKFGKLSAPFFRFQDFLFDPVSDGDGIGLDLEGQSAYQFQTFFFYQTADIPVTPAIIDWLAVWLT